jgi:hypothetical protein
MYMNQNLFFMLNIYFLNQKISCDILLHLRLLQDR